MEAHYPVCMLLYPSISQWHVSYSWDMKFTVNLITTVTGSYTDNWGISCWIFACFIFIFRYNQQMLYCHHKRSTESVSYRTVEVQWVILWLMSVLWFPFIIEVASHILKSCTIVSQRFSFTTDGGRTNGATSWPRFTWNVATIMCALFCIRGYNIEFSWLNV